MTRSCMKIKDAIPSQSLCRHHETCGDIHKIIITSEQIYQTVQTVAEQIQVAYADHTSVVVPFLLEGARQFAEDLEGALQDDKFNFVPLRVSSYFGATRSTGLVNIISDDMPDVTGQTVLLVDDIYDSGLTLKQVKAHFNREGATDVKACVMFEKDCVHAHELCLDFVGTSVPNVFVVGYGLDYQNRYRELHCVGILKPDILAS